jgi:hypothetical protein
MSTTESEKNNVHAFLFAEYQALREEILSTQRRNFQVIGAGAVLIPGINYVVHTRAEVLATILPFVVVVVVLIYLGDTYAITRCGRYIREQIEPRLLDDIGGWECWLHRKDSDQWLSNRTTERYMTAAIALLFLMYFAASSWLAFNYSVERNIVGAVVLYCFYAAIGSWLAVHLKRSLPLSTEVVHTASSLRMLIRKFDKHG